MRLSSTMMVESIFSFFILWVLLLGADAQDEAKQGNAKRRNHNVFLERKGASPSSTDASTIAYDNDDRKKNRGGGENKKMNKRGMMREKGGRDNGQGNSSKSYTKRKNSKSSKNKDNKGDRMDGDDAVFDRTAAPTITRYPTLGPTISPAPSVSMNPTRTPTTGSPVTRRPTRAPTTASPGSPSVTQAPTASIQQQVQCSPTVGPCIADINALTDTLINLGQGNTVSICPGTIDTSKALNIVADNTVLCCDSREVNACVLQSSGTDRTLEVRASSFSSLGITYTGGTTTENGGNLYISGPGDHQLVYSHFRNGTTAESGGNAYIESQGSVLVLGSSFTDGLATYIGGGLLVNGSSTVGVISSRFEDNEAPEGAGMYSTRGNFDLVGQQMVVEDSVFSSNEGVVGGGLMVSEMGQVPSLAILNTEFVDNFVGPGMTSAGPAEGGVGGSAMFFEPVTNLILKLGANKGTGNVASGTNNFCAGIVILRNAALLPECLQPRDTYPR